MPAIGQSNAVEMLERLNLNHLLYFWAVGRAGSITGAARQLRVSQPSVSEQVRALERRLGARLLSRGPRGVTLTPAGQAAMRYAEEVVGVCSDLVQSIPLGSNHNERPLIAGTADAVPKVVVRSILAPLLTQHPATRVVCREWRVDHLLAELSLHRLDLVISDAPLPISEGSSLRSFAGQSSNVEMYAVSALARKCRRGFPRSLADVPILLPAEGTMLRGSLDRWFSLHRIRPRVVAEVEDRALLHHFAEGGFGVVPIASVTARDVARQFGLERVGGMRNVREQYYVVVVERERSHPGVELLRERLSRTTSRDRASQT